MARPLSQRRVNTALGADLCGLSLVKQGRANGLEGLDSKVIVVEVRQFGGVTAQVCV